MKPASANPTPGLYGLERAELVEALAPLGARAFNTSQVYRWLYARRKLSPADWTDLPRSLRESVARAFPAAPATLGAKSAAGDGTVKHRVDYPGGASVETVYMPDRGRVTLCLSSQVGCALDCSFCLTAKMGLVRQLSSGEILAQTALMIDEHGPMEHPWNLVFMGMGEPLHNYDAVVAAVRILTDPEGFGLSRKRITISTAGLAPAIEKLAREKVRPRLAVSLNAVTDAVRDQLMPINRRYPLALLIEALKTWARETGERFTLEYVLLAGVNDSDADLKALSKLVRSLPAKLNLIPFNPVPGWLPYEPPPRQRVLAIRDRLLSNDVPVSVRFSHGTDARAACGQLALL